MAPKTNPIATITNNLGYDVAIYDVFNPTASTTMKGPLTYTKLATLSNGASAQQVQTIRYASQLQAMRTGTIAALNNNYYLQFPVSVLAVSPFADSNAFILTTDVQQAMEDSFKFIKYTQANPTSQLATNFRAALGDKTSQKTAVNNYFLATPSFKKCTLVTWTAVFTWQGQFTNPWQGTYYLYSLGSSSSGSASAPALVATMVIAASSQADSAVLTMEGSNNQNTSVVMGGDGTMMEKDQGTGSLSVVLNPTWLNVTQTSQKDGKPVTNYAIGAAFSGTINGTKVAGNLNKLAIPPKDDKSSNAKDKNSANSFTLSTLFQVISLLTGIGMLYYMAKGHKNAETQKKDNGKKDAKDKADADKKDEEVEKEYQEKDVPQQDAERAKVESESVPEVQGAYEDVGQAAEIQAKQSAVAEQINELSDILEGGAPSQATEDAAESLGEARDGIRKAMDPDTSGANRDTAVKEVSDKLAKTSEELKKELANEGSSLSEQEEKALENTKDALDAEREQTESAKENEKEREEKNEKDQENETNDNDFDDPEPEDPVEYEGPREI